MRLGEYLDQLSWSQTDLARVAKVSVSSVRRGLSGEKLSRRTAARIISAISKAMNKPILLADVEGLRLAPYRNNKRRPGAKTEQASTVMPAPLPRKTGKAESEKL